MKIIQLTYLFICLTLFVPIALGQTFRRVEVSFASDVQPGDLLGTAQLADLNQDGKLDVLLPIRDKGTLHFEQTGIQNDVIQFELKHTFPFANAIATADSDNDGDLDILMAQDLGSNAYKTMVMVNQGDSFEGIELMFPGIGFREDGGVLDVINDNFLSWGDLDRDGWQDIFITGYVGREQVITGIFLNQKNNNFELIPSTFPLVADGSVALEDIDQNGYLDLVLLNTPDAQQNRFGERTPFIKVYKNNDGLGEVGITEMVTNFLGLKQGSQDWKDFDQDGDLDVILAGITENDDILTKIYTFQEGGFSPGADFLFAYYAAGIDYDNDGDYDLMMANSPAYNLLFYQNTDGIFNFFGTELDGVWFGTIAQGDIDNDGDVDIFLAGDGGGSEGFQSYFYINDTNTNTKPLSPTNLQSTLSNNELLLSWEASTDAETPSSMLTYNVRIGTEPEQSDIVSAQALPDGTLLMPQNGNAGGLLQLRIKNIEVDKFYWSVQAIDPSGASSEFAPEASYGINVANESEIPQSVSYSVYPNPFHNQFTISSHRAIPDLLKISIMDVLGRVWYKEDRYLSGETVATLSAIDLPLGMYFLILQSNEGSEVLKLIKK